MNSRIRQVLVVLFCVWISHGEKPILAQQNQAFSNLPAASTGQTETAPAWQESLSESRYDLEEEHESNGPEGARAVPMQRLSAMGIVFALAALLASAALAARAGKGNKLTE